MKERSRFPHFPRRTFLAGVGTTAAGVFLRPLFASAAGTPPKRLPIVHRPCGTFPDQFFPAGNETGFRIQRCTGSKCTNFAFLTTVGANVTIYPDNGLSASTSYRYRIQAYNDVGDSAWSSIATVKTLRR